MLDSYLASKLFIKINKKIVNTPLKKKCYGNNNKKKAKSDEPKKDSKGKKDTFNYSNDVSSDDNLAEKIFKDLNF